eukprot:659534-Prymnesium_polylepis.2
MQPEIGQHGHEQRVVSRVGGYQQQRLRARSLDDGRREMELATVETKAFCGSIGPNDARVLHGHRPSRNANHRGFVKSSCLINRAAVEQEQGTTAHSDGPITEGVRVDE